MIHPATICQPQAEAVAPIVNARPTKRKRGGQIVAGQRRGWTRRHVLGCGAALAVSSALRLPASAAAEPAAVDRALAADLSRGLIDAHVHVWTPDLKTYPLAAGFDRTAMVPPSFTPEELLALARPTGVRRVVLIQMSFYRFDNSYMLDTIRRFPGVFSGVAVIDEHGADPAAEMRRLKPLGVRGFRIRPASTPIDQWLDSPGMHAMWKCGASEQLAMCALVDPNALAGLDRMCQRYPDTTLVVDHYARIGVDGTIRDADVDSLCRLARHQRAHVKVSAFYALGKKQSPYTDLAPMTRRLLDAFGPERLMWATDCPYQVQNGHTYADSVELVRSRLDFLDSAARAWLLAKTAERVYFQGL